MLTRLRLAPAVLALSLAVSCGGDDEHQDGADADTYDCSDETRDDEFVAGLSKVGAGGVTFTLTSADPAPPAKGDNHWKVTLTRDGAPVDGATLTIRPWMPDHGHGTQVQAVVTPETGGVYDVTPVNLRMPGFWEITLTAEGDSVKLGFCITG